MTDKVLCEIFRSPRREGMYLYVRRSEGLEQVPETLLRVFGKPESAMVIALDAGRKLARVEAAAVLSALESDGYFLQMPPSPHGRTAEADAALSLKGDEAC